MNDVIEAIYENGAFRPLHPELVAVANGQLVQLTLKNADKLNPIERAARVYAGLSEQDIEEIERIALDRKNYFGTRGAE
jgi:predicted DNA-binding antitoxin AbrB/MazE fold protein